MNDTYGRQVGDEVLISFAKMFRRRSRKTDSIGRWGGEEFIFILSETGKEGTLKLAEDLRKEIEEYSFPKVGHKTASFGATVYKKGDTAKTLVKRADDALYKAKENGRNQVVFLD